jgi:hypothetical protein
VEASGLCPVLRYCPGICLEGLCNATNTQDSWSLGQDLNLESRRACSLIAVFSMKLCVDLHEMGKN